MSTYSSLRKFNKTQLLEIARDMDDITLDEKDKKDDMIERIIQLRKDEDKGKSKENYSKYSKQFCSSY